MADQPAQYLQDNIGEVLSKALAEMSVAQPRDGVDFLSNWLKIYAEQEEVKTWRDREEKLLKEEREKTERLREVKEAKKARKIAEQKALDDMYNNLKAKFEDESVMFEDGFWNELVEVLTKWVGVQATYLGAYDEEAGEEGKVIQYDYASSGSEDMKEKILKEGQGVTFGALQAYEATPEEEPTKENFLWRPKEELEWQEPQDLPDGVEPPKKPCMKYYPVSVKCVTDVAKIHYFQMTRLGAYMAIPMIYSSYYSAEALQAAKTFREMEKKAEEEAAEEKKRRMAEAEEKGEELAEDPAPAEPVPEKKLEMPATEIKKVVCMDTLGTNTMIDEGKIPAILALFKACAECKARTETTLVDNQALLLIDTETRAKEDEEIEETKRTVKEASDPDEAAEFQAAEQQVADGEEVEEKKDLIKAKYVYQQARDVVLQQKDKIMAMRSWVYVEPKITGVFAAAMLMYSTGTKFNKESIYPKRKNYPAWSKLSGMLDEQYFQALEKFQVTGNRKGLLPEQKLSYIKGLVDAAGLEGDAAKEVSPAFAALFNMIQAAERYRTADVNHRTAIYKKMKAEAEEKSEAAPPPLSEQCDDCVDP